MKLCHTLFIFNDIEVALKFSMFSKKFLDVVREFDAYGLTF